MGRGNRGLQGMRFLKKGLHSFEGVADTNPKRRQPWEERVRRQTKWKVSILNRYCGDRESGPCHAGNDCCPGP